MWLSTFFFLFLRDILAGITTSPWRVENFSSGVLRCWYRRSAGERVWQSLRLGVTLGSIKIYFQVATKITI